MLEPKKNIDLSQQLKKIERPQGSRKKTLLIIPPRGVKSIATSINLTIAYAISVLINMLIENKIDVFLSTKMELSSSSTLLDPSTVEVLFMVLHFIYPIVICLFVFAVMGFFTGYTPGDKIFKLKLCNYEDKEPVELSTRFQRFALFLTDLIFLLGVGTMFAIFNKEGRTLEDKICKTIVLKEVKSE